MADCVKCLSGTEREREKERERERKREGEAVCAEFSAKQMFISISECSCEAIRLHYQEHTNYVGARATEGKRATHRLSHISDKYRHSHKN